MPIDYSKFDGIGSDDEEEKQPRDVGDLLKALQTLSSARGDDDYAPLAADPGPGPCTAPAPWGDYDGAFGLGEDPDDYLDFDNDPTDFGLGEDEPIDVPTLRREASDLLLARLVARPCGTSSSSSSVADGCAGLARALLVEAEILLASSQYRQALLASTALQLLAEDDEYCLELAEFRPSALVIDMVASYQLGDRRRATELRDRLRQADRRSLSEHLATRFDGTSEVLDLVPEFLRLMQEEEKTRRQQGSSSGAKLGAT